MVAVMRIAAEPLDSPDAAFDVVCSEPERSWQQITLVLPEDRGHRLGLVLKVENLRFVRGRRPRLRYVDTLNALADEHLLAINRQIGFVPSEAIIRWQLPV